MASAKQIGVDHKLWSETPLLYSNHISALLGCSAYLKLENLQPSQSFKYRGISLFVQNALKIHGPSVHLIIASGGNAGIAATCAAKILGVRCTVYIPEGVGQRTLDFLKKEGADVIVVGKFYAQALEKANEAVKLEKNAVMVPAYDDPMLWLGHSSMVDEMSQQLASKPDAIFCSVGGGGLVGGIMLGCDTVGWGDVPIITFEPHGSNCFYQSMSANADQFNSGKGLPEGVETFEDESYNVILARLSHLTSRATSLGASSPAAGPVKKAIERKGGVKCVCVPDELAMQAADLFAEDHKFIVELGCSITLSAAYKPSLFDRLVPPTGQPRTVVFVVCGGFKVSLDEMDQYREILRQDLSTNAQAWSVLCNGEYLSVPK